MDNYQKFIHLSRYARHIDGEDRRETWEETVERYISFFHKKFPKALTSNEWVEVEEAILNLEVMPSMRALMSAGKALDRDHVAGYNCSYLPIDSPRSFDEAMYILMCGAGVGFSVERQYVSQLPMVPDEFYKSESVITVHDSKIGWASAYKELIYLLYSGRIPTWDMSKIRPAGALLKTFGGRASGPKPLRDLFVFTVNKFKDAAGRRLSSLECHDIMCKIGDVVVVGGVRRSAMISLSNLSDQRMRDCKSGNWWDFEPQRRLSNNSACYTEKPDFTAFLNEMHALYTSRSGERGIFNRVAAQRQAEQNGRRDSSYDFGTNPCSEIILRPFQFCNLTEVVVRSTDTFEDLMRKVRVASILGTFQSTLTDFRYLRNIWKKNCEDERLLGVSFTGILDHPVLGGVQKASEWKPNSTLMSVLQDLRDHVIEINRGMSAILGINQATACTAVKPSGTVSQLVNSASGIHPRFSKYYIRTVRGDKKDPVSEFLIQQGVHYEEDNNNPSNWVFYFPIKSPEGAVIAEEMGAMRQLELWKLYAANWCEHKPSQTIYYKDSDFLAVAQWCWDNFNMLSGISFLPYSDHIYEQAPYIDITEKEYREWVDKSPKDISWETFMELEDGTLGSQTLACSGDGCEVVDI